VKRLKTDGVGIAYLDQGRGPLVVIARCSSASHKEWLPLIDELTPEWRVLAPDFIGYGQSDAWPEGKVCTGQADLGVLLELAKKTKKQVHFVGHSYGAAMALEAARVLGEKVRSLALVEPVSFNLLRVEGRPEWSEVEQLGIAVLTAVSNGKGREAAAAFMRYTRPHALVVLSREVQRRHHRNHSQVGARIHDRHRGQHQTQRLCERDGADFTDHRRQDACPTRAVVDMIGATLPNAEVSVLKGAGHMSPFTHPTEVNRMIAGHLAARRQ
jgi:pimeloyl-ACP methyl ester carboxylesterase